MYTSTVLSALAVVGAVSAQTASLCSQATATINSQADATQYAVCSTIKGDVVIGTTASGTISLDGPQTIDGSLIARSAPGLVSFGSTTLGRITKTFSLVNLTALTTLSTSRLTEVDEINFEALPFLPRLTFTQPIRKARAVTVTNTFLDSFVGISLSSVETLNVNNNGRLKELSVQIGNVTQSLNVDSNNKALEVSFPNLIWAANMTFRNVSSVKIPSLSKVNGSIGLIGNYFTEFLAPNLTTVGSSFALVANENIQNISLPLLKSVGGAALIANNSALADVSFDALEDVGGAIDFSGNFSTPSLPKLADVKGGFNVQSTTEINCDDFKKLSGNVIQGVFICTTTTNAKPGFNADGTPTSPDGSTPKKKGAAAAYGPNVAVAGVSLFGALLAVL